MSLLHIKLDALTEADLARLVADGIPESKTLEYKEALVYATDDQKRELLSDISALANTDGGDLLLGVKADKGIAKELVGLKNLIPDDAIGKIENLLRDFIQPRLLGIQFQALPLANGNHALIIRAPRSFASPHMVRHQGTTRFCGRNASGKYDLDAHELRSAFLASETLSERLRNFRLERINRIASGNTPAPLVGKQYIVLHLFPIIGARSDTKLASQDLQRVRNSQDLKPIAASGWGGAFNFEGLLVKSSAGDGKYHSYVQLMRNGFLEAVESQIIRPRPIRIAGKELYNFIPSILWEQEIIGALTGFIKALNALQLPPPYALSLSLLNVKGFNMGVDSNYSNFEATVIGHEHLLTEETLIESTNTSSATILRPLFDQIWNACGWTQSINYNPDGSWGRNQ